MFFVAQEVNRICLLFAFDFFLSLVFTSNISLREFVFLSGWLVGWLFVSFFSFSKISCVSELFTIIRFLFLLHSHCSARFCLDVIITELLLLSDAL